MVSKGTFRNMSKQAGIGLEEFKEILKNRKKSNMLKELIIICSICFAISSISAGDATTTNQYDKKGNYTGYYKSSGGITNYYDNSGKYTGYAPSSNGRMDHYDKKGRHTGYSYSKPDNTITNFYDSNGKYTGYSKYDSGVTRYYNQKGRCKGYDSER
jgi:hypothetical protein